MSGIDVLDVMDRAFCYAQNNCVYEDIRELDASRAAISELIEAGEEFAACDSLDAQKRFKAALSRMRGSE